MTIKLTFEEHYEPPYNCNCCGVCYPEHWTISLSKDGCADHRLWEYDVDGHVGGFQTEGCIVTLMRDALLALYDESDLSNCYQRKSIIDAHMIVEGFSLSLYSQWNKAKAYALALEDDGWDILVEERA